MSRIAKTMAGREDGSILMIDTIERQGELWLVNEWLQNLMEGWQIPKFMIRLTGHQYSTFEPGSPMPAKYFLEEPLPLSALRGESTSEWQVLVAADIRFPIPKIQ